MLGNVSNINTFEKLINQMPWYHVFTEFLMPHRQKYLA